MLNPLHAETPPLGDVLVKKTDVKKWLGGITDMTLYRYEHERPELEFPKPIRLGRHVYYSREALLAWKEQEAQRAIARLTQPKTKNGKKLGRPRKAEAEVKGRGAKGRTRKTA